MNNNKFNWGALISAVVTAIAAAVARAFGL